MSQIHTFLKEQRTQFQDQGHVDRPRLVDTFFIFSAVLPCSMLLHGKNSIYHEKNTMVSVVNIDSYEPWLAIQI